MKNTPHKRSRRDVFSDHPQVIKIPSNITRGKLQVICDRCKKLKSVGPASVMKSIKEQRLWICYDCMLLDSDYRQFFADLHKDHKYRSKVHCEEVRKKISHSSKLAWQDEEKRNSHMRLRATQEYKRRVSRWSKEKWRDQDYVKRQIELRRSDEFVRAASNRSKKLWKNKDYRRKIEKVLDRARPFSAPKNKISSLQKILYSLLDDLGVDYYCEGPETIVGPMITCNGRFEGYSFDCLVPTDGNHKDLYIECNGDYWHGPNREARDRSKASFLRKYKPNSDLLVLWECEFRSPQRIMKALSERLGISSSIKLVDFEFDEVRIKESSVTDELKCLFGKHHYLGNIGRYGSLRLIAELGSRIIAAAVFSVPTRNESVKRLGLKKGELLELSRFCIHPSYQKKNFASWFLSRSINILFDRFHKVKKLITFADSTYGHNGTIYKATNWIFDGEVKPDYWYVREGCFYHKKSIWDLASKNSKTEMEYAREQKLRKVTGKKKFRYIFSRKS